jgi:YD repeat-containing protein
MLVKRCMTVTFLIIAVVLCFSIDVHAQGTLPSGWSDGDIGSVSTPGSANYLNGVFTVNGVGSEIYNTSDSFHFAYQALFGDGTIVARVVGIQGGSPYATAGVMIRETLNANSTNAKTSDWPAFDGIYFDVRTSTGGSTTEPCSVTATPPYWVSIARSGSTFTSSTSADGLTWTTCTTTETISMAEGVYIGLAVNSGNSSGVTTATFDSVSISSSSVTPPIISGVSNTTPSVGSQVVISGSGFGASQGSSMVSLSGIPATINAWSGTSITITIPASAPSGPLVVLVAPSMNASNPVDLTIPHPIPTGWLDGDIGSAYVAGSAIYITDVFTLTSTGNGVGYGNGNSTTTDGLHFVYQALSGDGTITARILSLQGGWSAQAGVMIRETLDGGSNNAFVTAQALSTPYLYLWDRTSTGGSESTPTSFTVSALPYWVQLVRSGSSFTAYTSPDGVNWVQMGSSQTISIATNVYIGFAVTGGDNGSTVASATFDNVSVNSSATPGPVISTISATTGSVGGQVSISGTGFGSSQGSSVVWLNGSPLTVNSWSATAITTTIPSRATSGYLAVSVAPSMNDSNPVRFAVTANPLPPGWLDQDVGSVGVPGSATFASGVFTIQGAGNDVGGTGDEFHFVYQSLSGDGTITARIVSDPGSSGQAGVMIRETLNSGSTNAFTAYFPQDAYFFLFYRSTTGASESNTTDLIGKSLPYWAKLVRSGSNFTGYRSADGVNWVQIGSAQTIAMAQNVYAGFGVSSQSTSALSTATFDSVTVSSAAFPASMLSGNITTAIGGTAINGAQIQAMQRGIQIAAATSNTSGYYLISALPAGAYDVKVSASGYGTSITTIVVAGSNTTLNASLSSPGSISGTITQSDGVTPIAGVTVLADVGTSSAGSATTASNGTYTIAGLSPGNYQLHAFASGYISVSQPESVSSTTTANFSLQALSGGAVTYLYDALGRLVGVVNPGGNTAIYNYDAVGNLLSISTQSSSQLSVIAFTPTAGVAGSIVTVYGTGFSSTPSQNTVNFNGVAASVQYANPTRLVVTVPTAATTGSISVTTSAGTATSSNSFAVSIP